MAVLTQEQEAEYRATLANHGPGTLPITAEQDLLDTLDAERVSRTELARITKERDDWEAQVTEVTGAVIAASGLNPDGLGYDDALKRLIKDRDEAVAKRNDALNAELILRKNLVVPGAAEARVAELESACAAMRNAIDLSLHPTGYDRERIDGWLRDALSSDAGRALRDELTALRKVEERARVVTQRLVWGPADSPVTRLGVALDDLDAVRVRK